MILHVNVHLHVHVLNLLAYSCIMYMCVYTCMHNYKSFVPIFTYPNTTVGCCFFQIAPKDCILLAGTALAFILNMTGSKVAVETFVSLFGILCLGISTYTSAYMQTQLYA